MTRVAALAVVLAVGALLGAADGAAVQAQNPKLFGTVGPEFEVSFRDAQGNRVTKLDTGTYDIQVRDLSDFHTFHLQGPGVDERTEVAFTGTVNGTVEAVTGTVNGTVGTVTETVNGTVGTVNGTVNGTVGTLPQVVGPTLEVVNGVLGGNGALLP